MTKLKVFHIRKATYCTMSLSGLLYAYKSFAHSTGRVLYWYFFTHSNMGKNKQTKKRTQSLIYILQKHLFNVLRPMTYLEYFICTFSPTPCSALNLLSKAKKEKKGSETETKNKTEPNRKRHVKKAERKKAPGSSVPRNSGRHMENTNKAFSQIAKCTCEDWQMEKRETRLTPTG